MPIIKTDGQYTIRRFALAGWSAFGIFVVAVGAALAGFGASDEATATAYAGLSGCFAAMGAGILVYKAFEVQAKALEHERRKRRMEEFMRSLDVLNAEYRKPLAEEVKWRLEQSIDANPTGMNKLPSERTAYYEFVLTTFAERLETILGELKANEELDKLIKDSGCRLQVYSTVVHNLEFYDHASTIITKNQEIIQKSTNLKELNGVYEAYAEIIRPAGKMGIYNKLAQEANPES